MTGAYAQEWPGRGPWAQQGRGSRADGGYGGEREPRQKVATATSASHAQKAATAAARQDAAVDTAAARVGTAAPSDLEALAGWVLARASGKGGHRHERPTPEEIEELIALRRMRGFGGPGFGGPRGGRGRGRGRARRGDVRLAVLRLLADEPRNGYQLMQTIEERSGGEWRPSPGSMYPTLSQLEDEALIRSAEADGSRVFEITDAGQRAPRDPGRRAGSVDPERRSLRERDGGSRTARDRDRQGRLAGGLGRVRAAARTRAGAAGRDPARPVPDPRRGSR